MALTPSKAKKASKKVTVTAEDIKAYEEAQLKAALDYFKQAQEHILKVYNCQIVSSVSLDPNTNAVNSKIMLKYKR